MKFLPIMAVAALLANGAVVPAIAQTSNATDLGDATAKSSAAGTPGNSMPSGKVTTVIPSKPSAHARRYAMRHHTTPVSTTPVTNQSNQPAALPSNPPGSMPPTKQ